MKFKLAFWAGLVLAVFGLLFHAVQQADEIRARKEGDAVLHCTSMGGTVKMHYDPHISKFVLGGCDVSAPLERR